MAKMFKPEKKTVFELDQLEVGYHYIGQTGIAKNLTWGDIDLESPAIEKTDKEIAAYLNESNEIEKALRAQMVKR